MQSVLKMIITISLSLSLTNITCTSISDLLVERKTANCTLLLDAVMSATLSNNSIYPIKAEISD